MAGGTRERILGAALGSFATKGYEATSLDALAGGLGITKQSILYHFPSKEQLLGAVVDRSAAELAAALEATGGPASGWERVEGLVRSVFRLAARRPDLLALLREVTRLGAPTAARMASAFEPLVERTAAWLAAEMAAGRLRQAEPRPVVLSTYAAVIGVVTEVEVLRALGQEPSLRTLVRRRAELLDHLRAQLAP